MSNSDLTERWTVPSGIMLEYLDSSTIDTRVSFYRRHGNRGGRWYQWLFDQIPLCSGAIVLDVGCGGGDLWYANSNYVPSDVRLTLGDLSPGILSVAHSRLSQHDFLMSTVVLDATNLPFQNSSFDVVVCTHAFYHFPERRTALDEIVRILKPDGTLVASSIGRRHMLQLNELLRSFHSSLADARFGPDDYYGDELYDDLLKTFDRVECRVWDETLCVRDPDSLIEFLLATHLEPAITPLREELRSFLRRLLESIIEIRIETTSEVVTGSKKSEHHY
jgi:ubiquinone/menaquinone biosynthesis C-methylase UbiE